MRSVATVLSAMLVALAGCGARTALRVGGAPEASTPPSDAGRDAAAADAGHDAAADDDTTTPVPCSADEQLALDGTWDGPVDQRATITVHGGALMGVWLTNERPPFYGALERVGGVCVVRVTFPDDGTFVASLTAGGCEIDWSNATVWRRVDCL